MDSDEPGAADDRRAGYGRDEPFASEPLTRTEYLSVMVHFYRAEVHRSTIWRQRLDATTNWAVLTSAGMLSFTFASPANSHFLLLLTNLVVTAYLVIEARRYRRYEVYRARVRMLEANFLTPVLSRKLLSPMMSWRDLVCADLHSPTYKSRLLPAMGFRLRRTYVFIFGILLGAWLLKLEMHPTVAASTAEFWGRMGVSGLLTPRVVFASIVLFWTAVLLVLWSGRALHPTDAADEVAGVEEHPEHWRI